MTNKCVLVVGILNLAALAMLCWQTFTAPGPPGPPVAPAPAAHTYPCKLVRVVDANTVVVHVDLGFNTWLRDLTVHLSGVESPPAGSRRASDLAATLESLLAGHSLLLEMPPGDSRDNFNRWFGALVADGQNVNRLLRRELARGD